MKTILVADDKANIRNLVRDYLEAENFRVIIAANGREALYAARAEKPDLILLDIMMPEMSGYDFIKAYRKESETPIILLTAKLDETDKVLGLELGADDYVTKPFGMKELTARIHAVLRRALRTPLESDTLKIGSISLDKDSRTVTVDDEPASLTPSEFDLLYVLMSTPGKVFSRSDLLLKLQGTTFEGVERTIDVHIRNLRTKIEQDPSDPQFIITVFGVGYKFTSD
ncbi:MAG: response regulator transcription factor [Anaerolineales bacterium]|jgi:two-component system alkaline phosphatase synthesis response regulator PhoP|nr:response regulator transcription factor [Anaerolineales bacterium]